MKPAPLPTSEPLVASSTGESNSDLLARFNSLGYLYFPGFVKTAKCQAMLEEFLGGLAGHIGYDEASRMPVLTGEPFTETDATWDKLYPVMQSSQRFHEFFHEDDIQQLMQRVLGTPAFVYPMKMARVASPRMRGHETPPHQDAHSHQGGPTMAGIWVALHDVVAGMGRLKLLPGSHLRGVRAIHEATGVGGVQCEIFPDETCWHVSDVGQGDVIIFHACCIHCAEPNTTDRQVRISVDTRFCAHGEPVFITNVDPHHGWRIEGLDWQRIYRDWDSTTLQYYWRDYPDITRIPLADR